MKRSIVAMVVIVGLALTGCTVLNMDPSQALDPGPPPVGGTPVTLSMGETTLSPAGWCHGVRSLFLVFLRRSHGS